MSSILYVSSIKIFVIAACIFCDNNPQVVDTKKNEHCDLSTQEISSTITNIIITPLVVVNQPFSTRKHTKDTVDNKIKHFHLYIWYVVF